MKYKYITDFICKDCGYFWQKGRKCYKCGSKVKAGAARRGEAFIEGVKSEILDKYKPPRPLAMTPVAYYKKFGFVDYNHLRKTNGRFYCSPRHCGKSWKSKVERVKHLMIHKDVQKYILDNFNQADLIPVEWTNLLSNCLVDLFAYDVNVILEKSEHLSCFHDDDSCDGIFESDVPDHLVLKVATGSDPKHWFRAFVHEYAHFCQWKSMKAYINGSLELEIDCEKRAVKIMRKFNIIFLLSSPPRSILRLL